MKPAVQSISFIIVALNAEKTLPLLLDDLRRQTLSPEHLEVILVDSGSEDHTRGIMEEFRKEAPFRVILLDNPRRWLAAGCNLALAEATGDALMRVDAHARIPVDFLQKNLDALNRGEDIVGGSVLSAPPQSDWNAVMRALDTSRFCGGAAPFRNAGTSRYVDTLAYALYRSEVFKVCGPYDERLRRTEDNEMHYRMRKAGFRFRFCPEITSSHSPRDSLRGQIRQKWGNGYWIGRTLHFQPRCFAPRHLIPACFVLALAAALLLSLRTPVPLLSLGCAYLIADLVASVKAALGAPRGKLPALICLPFLFPLMHILYGTGTLAGLLTPEVPNA